MKEVLPRLESAKVDWDIIIFGDTICELNGKIIEKSDNAED